MRLSLPLVLIVSACSTSPATTAPTSPAVPTADPPGFSASGMQLTVIASAKDGLAMPSALAFAPMHPDELWVTNRGNDGVVIIFDPGTSAQRTETRIDAFSMHFMAKPTSIAFGDNNYFATCQDSRDEWNEHPIPPDDFMGPTLWNGDLDIYAVVNQTWPKPPGGLEGSHIDMLHESPLCMGLAHDHDNVFWAFDGLHGHVVRYDFETPHEPGGSRHSDGRVRRYMGANVHRRDATPSQLVFNAERQQLFVADTDADRVMRLDTKTGTVADVEEPAQKESLSEYNQMLGIDWEQVASVPAPTALALTAQCLYVYSSASGEVVQLSRDGTELSRAAVGSKGVTGMTIGPDGKIYFTDSANMTVTRVDP